MPDLERRYAHVNGVTLHYATAGAGEPLLLIHGFPQTWYEWRDIIGPLSERFTVIAPDYRGAGESSRPATGYDKITMAKDLRELVHSLGFNTVRVVGHDMGAMVAYRYAAGYRDEVMRLVLMDAPIPGTDAFRMVRGHPRAWHINFHNARDLAESLVAGREREYLTYFFKSRFTDPLAMSPEEMEVYIKAYSTPGGMRAGFEAYRAFDQDVLDNQPDLARKLEMPVMLMAGGASVSAPALQAMLAEIAVTGRYHPVADSGHWLCEQATAEVISALRDFL
jgi:pimeloyl-ACP methyl ester carboxylesterase